MRLSRQYPLSSTRLRRTSFTDGPASGDLTFSAGHYFGTSLPDTGVAS